MAAVNKVILVGNLGRDPETRYSAGGDAITNISIATTESWKDKTTGEKKEATEWHRVVFFGKLAEIAAQYLKKGSAVYIEGRLRTRKWQEEGKDRYTTEITADSMQMLGGRPSGGGDSVPYDDEPRSTPEPRTRTAPKPAPSSNLSDMDDDIPF